MKIEIEKQNVRLLSENTEEAQALFQVYQSSLIVDELTLENKEPKETAIIRRTQKKCPDPDCLWVGTKRAGVKIHLSRFHGVRGKNYEYQRKWKLNRKLAEKFKVETFA